MAYRQSLMKYAEKYGVSRASRKYNKSRSYIYFWRARWDGRAESLACQSRRPHSHPNQHTEAELKLIRDMRRRNPNLGMVELWHRLRQRGYTRRPESLFRVMRKLGLFPQKEKKPAYKPKPYQQMTYPGQRIQVDVKVVPRRCIAERLSQTLCKPLMWCRIEAPHWRFYIWPERIVHQKKMPAERKFVSYCRWQTSAAWMTSRTCSRRPSPDKVR